MAQKQPAYRGFHTNNFVSRPDGSQLTPAASLELANHSPTGFSWGYAGSGPAQLALAILLDHTGDPEVALSLYQTFKVQHVALWGQQWTFPVHSLERWISQALVPAV